MAYVSSEQLRLKREETLLAMERAGVPAWVIRDCSTADSGSWFWFQQDLTTTERRVILDGKTIWRQTGEQALCVS